MEHPLVTVFTLIYNTNPRYVIEAIESVRANNYPNLQHIIIDDCSPNPEPKRVVKQWIKDNNYLCEFYEHEVNFGLCKTLNHVLELTKGKYLFGCSDDLIHSDRIRSDVQTFEQLSENYAIVFSLSQEMDGNSVLQPRVFPWINIPETEVYWNILVYGNCLSAPSTTYKTELLRKVGGFNENIKFEDYEINLRLACKGYQFKCVPKVLSSYRVHTESISTFMNYRLENIRILSLFKAEDKIQDIIYGNTFKLAYEKLAGYRDAIKIYEANYKISWKLILTSKINNQFLLKVLNKLFTLNQV